MKFQNEIWAFRFLFATVILFVLIVWTFLVRTIGDIQTFAIGIGRDLEEFKEIADEAWNKMILQKDSDIWSNRQKRYTTRTSSGYAVYQPEFGGFTVSGTAATCNCCPNELRGPGGVNSNCPAGSRGAPGEKGICGDSGIPGSDGRPGIDGNQLRYGEMKDCIICPAGPPGLPGQNGVPGQPGRPGSPGPIGYPGRRGKEGAVGEAGVQGYRGEPGYPGSPGDVGGSIIIKVGRIGPKGQPGRQGDTGNPGFPGRTASPGFPGTTGRPGVPGSRGLDGRTGPPGRLGTPGYPGEDANYCPCPTRSQEVPAGAGGAGSYSVGGEYGWKQLLSKKKKKLLAGKI